MRVEFLGGPRHGDWMGVPDPLLPSIVVPVLAEPRPFDMWAPVEIATPNEYRTVTYELRHRRDRGRPVYVAPDFNPATLRAEAPLDQMRAESERLSPDATPTGVGDPLAGVLRSIDELLEGQ